VTSTTVNTSKTKRRLKQDFTGGMVAAGGGLFQRNRRVGVKFGRRTVNSAANLLVVEGSAVIGKAYEGKVTLLV
jgi:hypothetical protein